MYLKSVVSGLRLERENCLTQTVKTGTMQTVKLRSLVDERRMDFNISHDY